MYLLGVPRFRIMTSHKPLIPMFNKSCTKVPPRIEKWIMGMQDVDYELVYEPDKDATDPLDYLSRHPLHETGIGDTKKTINLIVSNDHRVVMKNIKEATSSDLVLQNILKIMKQNDWDKHKVRIRHEMCKAKGLLLRCRRIVISERLQKKVITAAHRMIHFGMTKQNRCFGPSIGFQDSTAWLKMQYQNALNGRYICMLNTDRNQ